MGTPAGTSPPSTPTAPPAAAASVDRFIIAAGLYALLVAVVLGHQLGSMGLLADERALWRELRWTPDAPWDLGTREPFCYRPLFRALVLAVCRVAGDDPTTSFGVFLTLSALSLLLAAGLLDVLLGRLGFSSRQRLAGVALFLVGFPVLFSHDIPVQTREDLLGYALIAATLVAVADDRPLLAGALGAVGATVRETCLLGVLPLALVSRRPAKDVLPGYVLPALALLLVRFAQAPAGPRVSAWQLFLSSTAPARERPLEALLYAFAAFGALWVAAGLRLADPTPPRHPLLARRVALAALAAVVGFGWTFGMVRENRVTYVLFPFVVPLALDLLASPRAAAIARSRPAQVATLLVLAAGAAGIAWVGEDLARVAALAGWIGDCFNPGVPSVVALEHPDGELEEQVLFFASPLQGPVVVVHLAASVGLLVGARATRAGAAPPAAPEAPAAPPTPAAPPADGP